MMSSQSSFAPGVVIDGITVYPLSWMWVWALAINGVEWAVQEVQKEEWKESVRKWYRDQNIEQGSK